MLQGYAFAAPMSAEALVRFVAERGWMPGAMAMKARRERA
jgi:hypothetical protein